jgi:enoyl-CoA hydratase
MAEDLVRIEREGTIAVLTLNRPAARNAVNGAMATAICEAMAATQDAAVIVLTGADPAFCAGLDLRDLGVADLGDLAPFVASVANSDVPVLAAVNGPAVTGGFEIALACDFIVASERAAFADTHLRVGVYPGPVAVDLPRRVGMAKARELSLTGDFVDADTALRLGLVNHVVAHDELLAFTLGLARAIAEQDPTMVRALRRDWDETGGLPLANARRVHIDHATRASGHASASGLASRRDAVLERSRLQRNQP